MKLAFIILAHKAPTQLARLVERLARPVFLHVDRKAPRAMHELTVGRPVPSRRVHWGSVEIVEATLAALQQAVRAPERFDYFTLLSGQDYPIKPIEAFEAKLAASDGRSFVGHFRVADWSPWSDGLDRFEIRHYRLGSRWIRLPGRRPMPDSLDAYGGHRTWTLSREAAEYAIRTTRERPEILRFFRRVFVPDESYFQTILCNSPLAPGVVDEEVLFDKWTQGEPHPQVLGYDDVPEMAESGKFFARKFDAERDPGLLDRIDRDLLSARPGPPGAERPGHAAR